MVYDAHFHCPPQIFDELHFVIRDRCEISNHLANVANEELEQEITDQDKIVYSDVNIVKFPIVK
jgi:hypothetical protein